MVNKSYGKSLVNESVFQLNEIVFRPEFEPETFVRDINTNKYKPDRGEKIQLSYWASKVRFPTTPWIFAAV